MECRLVFFAAPKLVEQKNFIIEDIDGYLYTNITGLNRMIVDKYQYIKPELNQKLKIAWPNNTANIEQFLNTDTGAVPWSTITRWNYLMIQFGTYSGNTFTQGSQKRCLYFINSWTWKGQNTAELDLKLDVLNTIGVPSDESGAWCSWDAKTLIKRQHQNRYKKVSTKYYWVVDKKHEGLNSILYKVATEPIIDQNTNFVWYYCYENTLDDPMDTTNVVDLYLIPATQISLKHMVGGTEYTSTIKSIDASYWQNHRKNPKVLKIIQWPYCPTDLIVYVSEGTYKIKTGYDDKFSISDGMIKIEDRSWDINSPMRGRFFKPYVDRGALGVQELLYGPTNFQSDLGSLITSFNSNPKMAKSIGNEPKLFHSDFYTEKIMYDTNTKLLKMEEFDFSAADASSLTFIYFQPSDAASSRMIFRFDTPRWKNGIEDYFNILSSSRNNELPLYNYAYYNYKLTQQGWDEYKQKMNLAFGAGSVVGRAINPTEGGIASAISSLLGLGKQWADADISMWNTADMLRQQTASIVGADDLLLFGSYTNNKLLRIIYQVSTEFDNVLWDLFYYNGYIQNKMDKPDTSSRFWFNYVQCEPVLQKHVLSVPAGVWEEYENKWRNGCTILHKNAVGDVEKNWDIDQEYENIERALVS